MVPSKRFLETRTLRVYKKMFSSDRYARRVVSPLIDIPVTSPRNSWEQFRAREKTLAKVGVRVDLTTWTLVLERVTTQPRRVPKKSNYSLRVGRIDFDVGTFSRFFFEVLFLFFLFSFFFFFWCIGEWSLVGCESIWTFRGIFHPLYEYIEFIL